MEVVFSFIERSWLLGVRRERIGRKRAGEASEHTETKRIRQELDPCVKLYCCHRTGGLRSRAYGNRGNYCVEQEMCDYLNLFLWIGTDERSSRFTEKDWFGVWKRVFPWKTGVFIHFLVAPFSLLYSYDFQRKTETCLWESWSTTSRSCWRRQTSWLGRKTRVSENLVSFAVTTSRTGRTISRMCFECVQEPFYPPFFLDITVLLAKFSN